MSIPSKPLPIGTTLTGLSSWFGGPGDSTDSGHTASGIPESVPGIAVYNRATLGGYWRVTAPNGRTRVLRQTDLGPAPWTGKTIDLLYSALPGFGYTQANYTNGRVTATYLGKNPSPSMLAARGRGGPAPSTSPAAAAAPASGDLFGASKHSDLMHGLIWLALVATGVVLMFAGLNRTAGGAPARTLKRATVAVAA